MDAKIQKWGNSLALRIPKTYARELGLSSNSRVKISVEWNRLVIEPVHHPTLSDLLAQVTPENVHHETDWSAPVGKELW